MPYSTIACGQRPFAAVDLIITDLAVFTFRRGQLVLSELMPGATLAEVQANTEAMFVNDL